MPKNMRSQPVIRKKRPQPTASRRIQHIVVPLDFSGLARQALTCAVPLARKHHAKISLVHVVPSPVVLRTMPDGGILMPLNTDNLASRSKAHLAELARQLLPDTLRGRTLVRMGNAAHGVVAAAKSLKADLIVLSNQGRSGLSRMLLGSTAERIVRHAHCPVLTVRRQPGAPATRTQPPTKPVYAEALPWRRILVPLDFSLTSLRALRSAVSLAQASGAQLWLLNIVEPNPYATGMESAALLMPSKDIVNAAKKHLSLIAGKFVPKSVRVTTLVSRGRAADAIVATAGKRGIDLIVLSTHGHTGLSRLLLGSTAEQVVRQAKCPVFVVRKSGNAK